MTTLNKTLEELKIEFSGIGGILHDSFSLTGNSVSSIKNNSNINQRKSRNANIDGIKGMQTKFSEAENELIKKSSAQIVSATQATIPQLNTYQNNIPYGVPAGNQVNQELYAVDEKTWGQFSKDMGKIFKKIGKEQLNAMTSQNSHLKGSDIENMVYSTCGSLSEWPQINPKSAGLGKCSKLFEVFNNHYKKYNGISKIDESKFYSDLMSSLHTCEIFQLSSAITGRRNTTGIQNFSKEVKVYNIQTNLWFPTVEERTGKRAKYEGFLREGEDSYGTFFDIGGFPITRADYINAANKFIIPAGAVAGTLSPRDTLTDPEYDTHNNAIKAQSKKPSNGMYSNYIDDTHFMENTSIVVAKNVKVVDGGKIYDVNKKYCMLYKYEGDQTDITKLKEIDSTKGVGSTASSYLFNFRKQSPTTSPGYLSIPSIPFVQNHPADTMITQATIALFELYMIRYIFGKAYPEAGVISAAAIAAGAVNPNIFEINDNIVAAGGHLATNPIYAASIFFDDLANTKNRLNRAIADPNVLRELNIFGEDTAKINAHPAIIKFKQLINNMDNGAPAATPASQLIHIQNVYNSNWIIEMPDFKTFNIDTFYTNLIGVANVFTNPAGAGYVAPQTFSFMGQLGQIMGVANFLNDPVAANNRQVPVLAYRFIMRRMVHWYKETYFPNAVPARDTNFASLYRRNATLQETVILTQARAQGGNHNILTNYKQVIPDINPIMVGGSKHKSRHQIKTGGIKSKIIQKGGTVNELFTGAVAADLPKLYANRKLMHFNPTEYELALKKYKDLGFTADYNKVRSLFDKISQISHLPLFFDGYDDTLNVFTNNGTVAVAAGAATPETGGCGLVNRAVSTVPLSFTDVAELFLFNSVNTTTTTLLIHFLKNVKACLNHFMTTDLMVANDKLSKQITGSQSDKIQGSLRELIKEIDKVVNFLKYNTLNLQEKTISLNDSATATFQFGNNEHYVKNLFLGANVFFSYNEANSHQSVVMRFTQADGAAAAAVNWEGDKFFEFLNRIVGCTENSNIFGNTFKFLTDSNNQANVALNQYMTNIPAAAPLVNNPYLERIRGFIKDKPDGCFGGIPFVSLDPKTFSSLMRSFYLLLGLRLAVGLDIQTNERIEEETEYSKLSNDKKIEITKRIQDTLTLSTFSTLAESLKTPATIDKANIIFNSIFRYLFIESRRLIAQVNQAKQEINKASKIGNKKNSKKGLFTGGGPASIYTFRKTSNSNQQTNLIKSEINFIKTTYQTSAEFEYMIDEMLIQIKKEIERRHVNNELHFFYYMDTHFRNFKIYMETYLLTIGDNNIPPEMAKKLQEYISYSPDKTKSLDSFKKLTQVPLIEPKYSDPLWWAKIERRFMDIQKINGPSQNDCIYRLFIITTSPESTFSKLKLRDLYIVDAFALATLNSSRSSDKYWGSTGDRTHVGIRKTKDSDDKYIYLDTNTIIKLTGIGSSGKPIKLNATRSQMKTQPVPYPSFQTGLKNINKAVRSVVDKDIRDLICGKFKYFDKSTNSFKTLIPLFLQASRNDILKGIVNRQKDDMFRSFEAKFRLGHVVDYRIYQMSDDNIKDLKKYRQWLYNIFVEQQMQLTLPPNKDNFDSIERTMISSFSTKFIQSNMTGKCIRVYNIYDYIVLQSSSANENQTEKNKKMSSFRNQAAPIKKNATRVPNMIQEEKIRSPDPNLTNTYDLGAEIISGFISRESLIKLMLLY